MQKDYPYIIIAFGVASVFILMTWFDFYDGVENKLLDLRFLNRGKIETRSDIATLDMDAKSLQEVGRWPWSREKHIPTFLAAKEHQMDALAFDIFFDFLTLDLLKPLPKYMPFLNPARQHLLDSMLDLKRIVQLRYRLSMLFPTT